MIAAITITFFILFVSKWFDDFLSNFLCKITKNSANYKGIHLFFVYLQSKTIPDSLGRKYIDYESERNGQGDAGKD